MRLPITDFRTEIISAVSDNPVTIITAETGAGKSTQVPQYLIDEDYNIVVTQPRRLAARMVAERVAEEYGCPFGDTVGFRTAYERQDSQKTRCLFVTDGLALVRELMGVGEHTILVLDEVHEWNLNMEVLVAWAKRQIKSSPDFKVVIMSATLEAEKMSAFFDNAPVISVPGRLFPVVEKPAGESIIDDAAELLKAGRNVLIFHPGKAEISATVEGLKNIKDLSAEILPLHGQLSSGEQKACFKHYAQPKCVVSTNVAQTSVTIDDIDAVIDSGMERRVEIVDSVEGLYLKPVSKADAKQRKGRSGRCKEGVYIDHCPTDRRLDFPKAEILRVRLDQMVLRLAQTGIDAEEMEFFHQPEKSEIREAKRALRSLGCMDDDNRVTAIGRQVARLPISVHLGRMIVEANRLGVVDDVIDLAAVLEQGEVTARYIYESGYKVDAGPVWKKVFCQDEQDSDVMAQLAVFQKARKMSNDERRLKGVFVKAYYQAKEKRRHLAGALRGKVKNFQSTGQREDIVKCLISGMVDHLYHLKYDEYYDETGESRRLNRGSVINSAEWLVGFPWDLQIKARRGGMMTLSLVTMATRVTPEMLISAAPQAVEQESGLEPNYSPEKDMVFSTTRYTFDGQLILEEIVESPDHPEAFQLRTEWLSKQEGQRIDQCWRRRRDKLEVSSWISNPEEVLPHLSKLLSEVEITRDNGGLGEPIYGYCSLYSDSDPDFKIKLRGTKEEAEKETLIGLERLLQKATGGLLVPLEEPWKSSGWGSSLTQLGENLKKKFDEMIAQSIKTLSAENFSDEVERLKIKAEKAKAELGREYFDILEYFNSTKEEFEKILESIDKTLVEEELRQIERQISDAKSHLTSGSYEKVYSICSEISLSLPNLFQTSIDRQKEKSSAEEGYQKLVERLGEDNRHVVKVKDLIFSSYNCDYQKAIDEIENLKDLVTAGGEMALTFERGKNLKIFSLRGDDCQEGIPMEDGELRVYDGYDNVLMARGLNDGVDEYFSAQVGEDLEGTVVLQNSDEPTDPDYCLVFVHEYSPGNGGKRWPSFYITWGEETRLIARRSRSKFSGSDTYSLVIAPIGWAENIAVQFVNERDCGGQEIAYKPDFAGRIKVISEDEKELSYANVGNEIMRAAIEKAKKKRR